MEYITLENGNIIVQLGGMQVSREQLDAVKRYNNCKTDRNAADHLIWVAENAFSKELALHESFDPNDAEWYKENCHLL